MLDPKEIREAKIKSLFSGFNELGYKSSTNIGQNEFSFFLNKRSKSGRFDETLLDKLFEFLSLDQSASISIEEFINGFLEFEEDLKKNAELFNIKFAQEQEIYSNILKQCRAYQSEKLNAEGLCENAKIYGEITDIDIKRKLEGIKEIIIIIVYNEKKEEIHFKIGDINSNEKLRNKTFEFKPTSRRDHFEFIMKGVNERDQVFDIGSRVFPLDDVDSQEEYLVQIIIPEIDNPNQIAAYIHAKIVLYWSDFKHYERLRKKQEKRLKKYSVAANKAAEYLKKIREIYGDLSQMKPDLIVDFNNEKLMQRKGAKLNVNFNNVMEAEAPGENYYVEFNNEREVQKRVAPLRVEFNNSKEVLSPVAHTQNQNYEYKYNYSSNVNQEIINKTENILNNLNSLEKDFNNINTKINTDLPNSENIEPNFETVNIKKTTEIYKTINKQEMPRNEPQIIPEQNEEIPDDQDQPQVFSNEEIIKEQIHTSQNINDIPVQSPEPQYVAPNNDNNIDYKTHIKETTTKTVTETTTQNISSPQYILHNSIQNQNPHYSFGPGGNNFEANSSLHQTTTQIQNQTDSQQNQNNQYMYGQNGTNFDIDAFLHQTTTQTQNQTQSQYETHPLVFDNGSGGSGFVHEQTTETTKTTTTIPIFNQNQFNFQQSQQNIYNGENANLRNINQTTTTTTTTTTNQNQSQNGQYQIAQRVGYGTDDGGNVNAYEINGKEIIDNNTNIQTLDPIVNQTQMTSSVNKAIFNETVNKILQSENTLPVSYLPEKVNEVIVDTNVRTLPLITTPNSVSYDTLNPIVHETQTYYTGENNNINYTGNDMNGFSAGNNINISSTDNMYDYSSNLNNNINANGIINNDINSFGDSNNWFGTTQTTQTTTTTTTNYNPNNFNFPLQDGVTVSNQQVQYGI